MEKKKRKKKIFEKIQETKIHAIRCFPAGSFAVHIGDHLRFGIICGRISGSFSVWGSFAVGDHLRRCTVLSFRSRERTLGTRLGTQCGSCAMTYDDVSHAKNGGEFINRMDIGRQNSRNWKMLAVKLGLLGKNGNCWS